MKKSVYLSGIAGLCIMFIGVIFKIRHLTGAGIILVLGVGLLAFLFMPIAYFLLLKSTNDKILRWVYHMAFVSFLLGFLGMMFKVMHWQGASIIMMIAIPAPFILFLPIYIRYHNKRKLKADLNFFTILFFMIYLGLFTALLSLRISKNVLYSNANLEESIKEINTYLMAQNKPGNDKNLSEDVLQLVNQIEQIKIELACFAEPKNVSLLEDETEMDIRSIHGKEARILGYFNSNRSYSDFISHYNLLKHHINELKPERIDFINNLFLGIDQNFMKREGEEEIILSHSALIVALYTLTDCQNKILLINHELNQRKI